MANSVADLCITNPDAYREKLYGLLGDDDPIEVLSRTADALAAFVRDNAPEHLRARPFEGKWTPNEIIGHLLDVEWTFGFRLRYIRCEDQPTILGMDQNLWVSQQRHNERDPADLVAAFRPLREENVHSWRALTPADLERTGNHVERGPESLGQMLRMEAGHDLSHIDQIRRYLKAVKGN